MNVEATLMNVRFSFVHLDEPKAAAAGGKPRYSCNFILNDEGKAQVEKIIRTIEKEEFNGRVIEGKDSCFRDGNKNLDKNDEVYKGFEDKFYVSAARAEKRKAPRVVSRAKRDITAKDPEFPQAGDYGNVVVSFFSVNGKNDKGGDATYGKKICCEIGIVQRTRHGESLGGGNVSDSSLPELPDEELEGPEDFDV